MWHEVRQRNKYLLAVPHNRAVARHNREADHRRHTRAADHPVLQAHPVPKKKKQHVKRHNQVQTSCQASSQLRDRAWCIPYCGHSRVADLLFLDQDRRAPRSKHNVSQHPSHHARLNSSRAHTGMCTSMPGLHSYHVAAIARRGTASASRTIRPLTKDRMLTNQYLGASTSIPSLNNGKHAYHIIAGVGRRTASSRPRPTRPLQAESKLVWQPHQDTTFASHRMLKQRAARQR